MQFLNIRAGLKRDNITKHVMIVTKIRDAVTICILLALVWYAMFFIVYLFIADTKSIV